MVRRFLGLEIQLQNTKNVICDRVEVEGFVEIIISQLLQLFERFRFGILLFDNS
jgi:hypothetical protein